MSGATPDLSLVIASYNDARILPAGVAEIAAVLDQTRLTYELIFVDDASRDDSWAVIEQLRHHWARIPTQALRHATNQGRGQAVRDGFRLARGRIAGFLDVDLEVHARYLPALVDAIDRQGYDAATAWRIYKLTWSGLVRAACSQGYRWLVHAALGLPYRDTETGCKCFSRGALERVLDATEDPGWFWDTEIMAACHAAGLRVAEVPALFLRRQDKVSSVRVVRDSLRYARSLWRCRARLPALRARLSPRPALSRLSEDSPVVTPADEAAHAGRP